jgi:MFS family permease
VVRRAFRRVERARRALPENVRVLGWVSLANDAASELAYPVLPLFLTITLGAPVAIVGLIEGAAEGIAMGVRLLSGWVSDKSGRRRRPWIVGGYALSTVSRGLTAAAPGWGLVLVARVADRIGKGARGTPRDALIRDSTPPELRGSSFGYHRAMDTIGAVIGPAAAIVLLEAGFSLREVLAFAVAPGLATLLLLRRIREAPAELPQASSKRPTLERTSMPAGFWAVLAIWVTFSLGNSSDAFLLLRARNLGLGLVLVIAAYTIYNVVYAGLSWPLGSLSDRIPRSVVLGGGLVVFAFVYVGFAVAPGSWAVWPLLAAYGVYIAATEGVARAWVADHAPDLAVGTAYGIFFFATAAALLAASIVAGVLWTYVSPRAPFLLGAGAAAAAALMLLAYGTLAARTRHVKAALALVAAVVVAAAAIEHGRLWNALASGSEGVPAAAVRPCDAPPRAIARPVLPARFPTPGRVTYTRSRSAGPSTIVDGYLERDVAAAYDAYKQSFSGTGYAVVRSELDPADAEVNFLGHRVSGQVKLTQECRKRTRLRITIRPA